MFFRDHTWLLLPFLSALDGALAQGTSNTTHAASNSTGYATFSGNVASTVLVIAADDTTATVAAQGLNGYGIPFEKLVVPQAGAALPALSSSAGGNYGGIIVANGVVYEYSATNYSSALTNDQWNALYDYQINYGVRMVQYGIFPNLDAGVVASGGCCNSGILQPIYLTNTSSFSQAGLKANAQLDTSGLYHYPSTISNTSTTTAIAEFGPSSDGSSPGGTAAVINNFESGRQQMVFFIDIAPNWSATSAFLQHAYITWLTRGVYAGYRRIHLNTQIDDMFLETDLYLPNGTTYRVTPDDLTGIVNWAPTVLAGMPAGSNWTIEIGFNGNGNIEQSESSDQGYDVCSPDSIEYGDQPDHALEFKKPLGSGTDIWPATPSTYNYSLDCLNLDPLKKWFDTNVKHFNTISHTFTHEDEDNATYADVIKEIEWNQLWLAQSGIGAGDNFTPNGLIPPAITGLHNGDALRAWHDAGLVQCVGDNSRPVLRNQQNDMWPYITEEEADGFAGIQVNGRWPTRIYFNCDTPTCTTQEWIATSAGSGTFEDLLAAEKADTMRYLFGLYHDAFMFHQANLRTTGDLGTTTINGVSATLGIFQAWVETIAQEFVRLVDWPILSLKQVDFSAMFANRMARDACSYGLSYAISSGKITGVTVTANGNTCGAPIPVTVPGTVTDTQGFTTEQIGSDPLTIWVRLSGSPVTFTLSQPVAL